MPWLNPEAIIPESEYGNIDQDGMSRKVLLMMAVSQGAEIIIADEPSPGLDASSIKAVLDDFQKVAKQRCAVLFITHDISAASTRRFLRFKVKIRAVDISFGYGKKQVVLSRFNFEIQSGEIIGLMGKSGIGKTTLVKILAGYENPKWKMDKMLKESGVNYKPLMKPLGIDPDWLNRWPNELSGGELQRFCVLRALHQNTKFIIAISHDEVLMKHICHKIITF